MSSVFAKAGPYKEAAPVLEIPEKDGHKQRFEKIMEEILCNIEIISPDSPPFPYAILNLIGKTPYPLYLQSRKRAKNSLLEPKNPVYNRFFLGKFGVSPSPLSENFVCLKIVGKLSDITYIDQSVGRRSKKLVFFRNLS